MSVDGAVCPLIAAEAREACGGEASGQWSEGECLAADCCWDPSRLPYSPSEELASGSPPICFQKGERLLGDWQVVTGGMDTLGDVKLFEMELVLLLIWC